MTAPQRQLLLASTSRYRRGLLERLGVPFDVASPPYEEEHELPLAPEELVLELAEKKARSLAEDYPDALIIGSDQVAELGGEILLKPGTPERAVAQLRRMAGRTHRLLTAVAVVDARTGRVERALDVHHMAMRDLDEESLRVYVRRDDPVDCAGSYKVESLGAALFRAMKGNDHTAIIGLPLTRVVELLDRFGFSVF